MNEYILKTLGKVKVKKMLRMFISEHIDDIVMLSNANKHGCVGDFRICWDGLISDSVLAKFGLPEINVSKPPWLLITNSGALSVSFHSSPGGVNSIEPIHVNTLKGFTLIALLAKGWSIKVVSV